VEKCTECTECTETKDWDYVRIALRHADHPRSSQITHGSLENTYVSQPFSEDPQNGFMVALNFIYSRVVLDVLIEAK
jgi:hypothetical protein